MDKDKLTTIVGAVGAAALAAEPVLHAVDGALTRQDYFSLVAAIMMKLLGFFSNK